MIVISVVLCIATLITLVWILRREQISLGLPIAYLVSLLLIHVPGAVAHVVDTRGVLAAGTGFTKVGIGLTAVSSIFFVLGVWLAHRRMPVPVPQPAHRTQFARFCVFAGTAATIVFAYVRLPSIGAVMDRGSLIWMLAIIFGLKTSVRTRDYGRAWKWIALLAVYPTLMLLVGGYLSYGVAAAVTVLSILVVTVRSGFRVLLGTTVAVLIGISIFISYYEHRSEIRGAVWGGASAEQRISASIGAAKDVAVFSRENPSHLIALDERLNQNYFVGRAAARLEAGNTRYLYGRSLYEGFAALVPRALWPDKPMVAGSGSIVSQMTGLQLATNTSFGVGNVMEFYINFGIFGIVLGFLFFGWGLARLDRAAATADVEGDLGRAIVFFLPAVALIQPNGSIVEMTGGAASALAAAMGWKWLWSRWARADSYQPLPARRHFVPPIS